MVEEKPDLTITFVWRLLTKMYKMHNCKESVFRNYRFEQFIFIQTNIWLARWIEKHCNQPPYGKARQKACFISTNVQQSWREEFMTLWACSFDVCTISLNHSIGYQKFEIEKWIITGSNLHFIIFIEREIVYIRMVIGAFCFRSTTVRIIIDRAIRVVATTTILNYLIGLVLLFRLWIQLFWL